MLSANLTSVSAAVPAEKSPTIDKAAHKDVQTEVRGLNALDSQAPSSAQVEVQIEAAIAQLTQGDFHAKWDYAKNFTKAFARWGDRPIPYLISYLHSIPDDAVENQWFLIRTLGYFNHPTVVEALASFLMSTPVEELQAEATRALTGLGNNAIATLTQLIEHPSTAKRILAARTLAKIRRTAVIEPLLSVTADPDSQLRAIAIEALGSFHDSRITPVLLTALTDDSAIAIEAIRALGRRSDLLATEPLIEALGKSLLSPDTGVARESAIALGRLGGHAEGETAALTLGKFLTQSVPSQVKIAAARALGWLDSAAATQHLTEAFNCDFPVVTPEVKQEIARSLSQTHSATLKPTAAKPLIEWLVCLQCKPPAAETSDNLTLKQAVITALARLGALKAIDPLIPFLADSDDRIRMHTLSALKQIDPRIAQAKVQAYLASASLLPVLSEKITNSLSAW